MGGDCAGSPKAPRRLQAAHLIIPNEYNEIRQIFAAPPVRLSKADILDFSQRNDPQHFYIDEEATCSGPFGWLVASGFHTMTAVRIEWIRMDVLGRDCPRGMSMQPIT